MELKQKVITWQITIGALLVLGFGGYFTYFFFKDILPQPPEHSNTQNLFIAKTEIDIANIQKTKNFSLCMEGYNIVYYSLVEDKINGFLDENTQENEKQYNRLYKKSVFTYAEQFILIANQYFEQSEWNKNDSVRTIVQYIKRTGFVENNTPNWNTLSGFESNIACYNEMKNCINDINRATRNLNSYFPSYDIQRIKNQKENLLNRKCKQNGNRRSQLTDNYNNLKSSSYDYFSEKIKSCNNRVKNKYYSNRDNCISDYNAIFNDLERYKNIFGDTDLSKKLSDLLSEINANYQNKYF
jgi:hypothetical protein